MRTIHKFQLVLEADQNVVIMPKLSKLLTVQAQRGEPWVWAEVDSLELKAEEWVIYAVGTGHERPHPSVPYLGTIQLFEGNLVIHYYAETVAAQRSREGSNG